MKACQTKTKRVPPRAYAWIHSRMPMPLFAILATLAKAALLAITALIFPIPMPGAPAALRASPLEMGVTFAGGTIFPGEFQDGINRYRSSLGLDSANLSGGNGGTYIPGGYTRAARLDRPNAGEIWFRFGDLFAEGNRFGLMLGRYDIPSIPIKEFRSDGSFTMLKLGLQLSYFGFTYDYLGPISRRFSWEGSFAMGFLNPARLKVSGYDFKRSGPIRRDSSQTSNGGNLWRLGLGLYTVLNQNVALRTGFRLNYFLFGNLRNARSTDGSLWYFTRDGGLLHISTFELSKLQVQISPDLNRGVSPLTFIREPAYIRFGTGEIYISLAVRI